MTSTKGKNGFTKDFERDYRVNWSKVRTNDAIEISVSKNDTMNNWEVYDSGSLGFQPVDAFKSRDKAIRKAKKIMEKY